jgi:uncharacterized peroxidase-related enzyme
MALVELKDDEAVSQEIRDLFDVVAREYGFVPNILRAMSHCPDLVASFVPLWAQVYKSPTIGARWRALAALGTAKAQQCTYCMAHMSASARRAGLEEPEILAIGDAVVEKNVFDTREALILELAEQLTQAPDGIGDELRSRLREQFSEPEIVNIVLAIAMYNLTSRFLKGLDIGVEEIFDHDSEPATGGPVPSEVS